ncbi:MAG TPA: efflux RND transporter periplasmic adaptor subunit [Rhodanobacteraceae bacterium]|nr:efflux RND transporter periplasmic adaptor subunit [Rhodanobacteraceae bacterium]
MSNDHEFPPADASDRGHGGDDAGTTRAASPGRRRRILLLIAAAFALIAVVWILLWLFVFSLRETTEDAYVDGNQVTVSAQHGGTVVAVLADDTQRVATGQVLVRLDPTDTRVALAQARAALAAAVRQVRQLKARAAQSDAGVDAQRVALSLAKADLARRQPLLAAHAVAAEEIAHLRERVKSARSALDLAERQAAAAHAAVDGTDVANNPAVLQARASFRKAWLADHRNAIVAPVGGYVAQRSVQVGQQVKAGQALMQVLPLHDLWIDANFKESQLQHIRIGQPVEITTDIYGDVTYHGTVAGLGAGTGSAFALLPPQNASGNWIKIVQRVPVRITLEPEELARHPLRVGLSAEVTVDTHDRSGAVLAQAPAEQAVASTRVYANDFAEAERQAAAIIRANLGSTPTTAASAR